MNAYSLVRSAAFFAVCSLAYAAPPQAKINLTTLQSIKVGVATKQFVTELFGKPTSISHLEKTSSRKEPVEVWEYAEKETTRLRVSFISKGDFATGWTLHVKAGTPEKELKTALQQFPAASWQGETEKWINPHHDPVTCFYRDRKIGVSIRYNEFRKEVESISMIDPARELASQGDDEKPPKFCIENACADAIPAKEWAKSGPTCPVPK